MRAYSAGGVVFRLAQVTSPKNPFAATFFDLEQQAAGAEEVLAMEVVLVGRSNSGLWALPKGTPQPGETLEQVAIREVQEETGLQVRLLAYIGSISYSFIHDQTRYYKQVRHFLLEAIGGDLALHDQEYDQVEWFPLPEACRRLTYQNEAHILYQAEETLQRWVQYQREEGQK